MKRLLIFAALLAGCANPPVPPPTVNAADADHAADRLQALLPDRIAGFAAKGPAEKTVQLPTIRVERRYANGKRTLTVEIATGDVRQQMTIIAQNEEHAFGSDTPTYWRTVDVKGRRARIAENREKLIGSETWLRIASNVAARVNVDSAAMPGESAFLVAALDLDALAKAGVGAPSDPARR